MCSTPRQELSWGLAAGRACTPSTLPGLPRTGPGSSQGLASRSRSPSTSPPTSTQETGIILHTVGSNINTQNTANTSDMPTFANFVKASLPVETSSRKPKPMHIVKKRGIIPDGLVQTRLNHFRQLTNQGIGNTNESKLILGLTNGKAEKRKAGNLDYPNANRQRRN